jgi:uncharacterized membrane protein YfcA
VEIWLIFAATGLLAGFMAGLLGIGGGFVVVPLLLIILPQMGFQNDVLTHFSIGTSLACIVITSLSSSLAHHKKQAINWLLLKPLVPGLVLGAFVGSLLAGVIKGEYLVLMFVIGALLTAVYLISGHQTYHSPNKTSGWLYFFYAQFTGVISSLIGIGGGSVLVPFLVYRGQIMVKSVGTAAACGFPIALVGCIGFIVSGWSQTSDIEYTSGYIYWPAFLGIVLFSSLSAPFGARLAHFIAEKQLKRVFALFLILTSGQIIYSQWFS